MVVRKTAQFLICLEFLPVLSAHRRLRRLEIFPIYNLKSFRGKRQPLTFSTAIITDTADYGSLQYQFCYYDGMNIAHSTSIRMQAAEIQSMAKCEINSIIKMVFVREKQAWWDESVRRSQIASIKINQKKHYISLRHQRTRCVVFFFSILKMMIFLCAFNSVLHRKMETIDGNHCVDLPQKNQRNTGEPIPISVDADCRVNECSLSFSFPVQSKLENQKPNLVHS